MVLAEEDKGRLARTLHEARKDSETEQVTSLTPRKRTNEQYAALKRLPSEMEADGRRLSDQIKDAKEAFQKLDEELREARRANESLLEQLATERREMRDQADKQCVAVLDMQAKTAEEAKRLAAEVQASEEQRRKLEGEQQEARHRFDRLMEQFAMDHEKQLEQTRKRSESETKRNAEDGRRNKPARDFD